MRTTAHLHARPAHTTVLMNTTVRAPSPALTERICMVMMTKRVW